MAAQDKIAPEILHDELGFERIVFFSDARIGASALPLAIRVSARTWGADAVGHGGTLTR